MKGVFFWKSNIKIFFIIYVLELKVFYICWNMVGNYKLKIGNYILLFLGKYVMIE